jgi:cysteine desulfurase/selenocysteine lyase
MRNMIYLDNAATSLKKPPIVYQTLDFFTRNQSANAGHGGHDLSIQATETLVTAKTIVAEFFHIEDPAQIVFCQNTTLALNMGITGLIKPGDHVIISSMEHNSVSRVVHAAKDVEVTVVEADKEGYLDPPKIEAAIKSNTVLIVINHASNVTGSLQDIKAIGEIAKEHHVFFMVDAAQTAGVTDIFVDEYHIDMLAFAGHKSLYGPLGTGGLYVSKDVPLRPILYGGTGSQSESATMPDFMPDMLQAGTINVPSFAALAQGVKFVSRNSKQIREKEEFLTKRLITGLLNCSSMRVFGSIGGRGRVGVVSFLKEGTDSVIFSNDLNDKYHIAVRAGLHCAYLAHQTIGTEKIGTVRASMGFYNTQNDIDALLYAVNRLCK